MATRFVATCVMGLGLAGAAAGAAQGCSAVALAQDRANSGPLTVTVEGPAGAKIDVNARITVRWKLPTRSPAATRGFVVVSLPDSVRLEGDGFLVFPPSVALPFESSYRPGTFRVVFPLYLSRSRQAGSFSFRQLKAGDFRVISARIVVAECAAGPTVAEGQVIERRLHAIDRKPMIVIQDQTTAEAPRETRRSPSGEYQLRIFRDYFEIVRADTRQMIFRSSGTEPRFSATSRFLAFIDPGRNFRVRDMLSHEDISFSPSGGVKELAWLHGDALVANPDSAGSLVTVQSTFVDGRSQSDLSMSGSGTRAVPGDHTGLSVDGESALLIYQPWGTNRVHARDLLSTAPEEPLVTDDGKTRWEVVPRASAIGRGTVELRLTHTSGLPAGGVPDRLHVRFRGVDNPVVHGPASGSRSTHGEGRIAGTWRTPAVVMAPVDTSGTERRARLGPIELADLPSRKPVGRLAPSVPDQRFEPIRPGPICGSIVDGAVRRFYSKPMEGYLQRCNAQGCTGADRITCFRDSRLGAFAIGIASWSGGGSAGFMLGRIDVFHLPPGSAHASHVSVDLGGDSGGLLDLGHFGSGDIEGTIDHLGRVFLTSAKARLLAVYDPARKLLLTPGLKPDPSDTVDRIAVSRDGDLIVSRNRGGRSFVYSIKAGRKVLNSLEIDDETVLFTDDGFYQSTPEGAHFVQWFFPGLREHHSFSQFASIYDRPDIVRAAIEGTQPAAQPSVLPTSPPRVEFDIVRQNPGDGVLEINIRAGAVEELKALRLYVDGAPYETIAIDGLTAQRSTKMVLGRGLHAVTAVAVDSRGITSAPRSAWVRVVTGSGGPSRLLSFGVGVDVYERLAAESQLKFSVRDVRALADALVTPGIGQFTSKHIARPLVNAEATPSAILAGLAGLVAEARREDLVLLHFAGHGVQGSDGNFYFLATGSDPRNLAGTALAWKDVAAVLSGSQARVLVLLDACHSGLASRDMVAPNDAYAQQLVRSGRAGMLVFAASKGHQFSLERAELGHGLFTHAVLQVLLGRRALYDENGDGVIDLAEFYRAVKLQVLRRSQNRQSPWISRNEFVGAVPLF